MRIRFRSRAVVTAASTLVAVAALTATPALIANALSDPAGTGSLAVSDDGITFTESPDFTLFESAGVVVPADTAEQSVWVRNTAAQPGRLRIDLTHVTTDNTDLASALGLAVQVPGATPATRVTASTVIEVGSCVVLTDEVILQPGETLKLDATLLVSPDLGSQPGDQGREGTRSQVGFELDASIADPAIPAVPDHGAPCSAAPTPTPTAPEPTPTTPVPTPTTPGPTPSTPTPTGTQGPTPLPATGTAIPEAAMIGALVLLVAGGTTVLVARRRARRD